MIFRRKVCFLAFVANCISVTCASVGVGSIASICDEDEAEEHPLLCHMLKRVEEEPEVVAEEMATWAREARVMIEPTGVLEEDAETKQQLRKLTTEETSDGTPIVFAHGMGDSCFNSGLQSLTKHAAKLLGGVYGICIPTGDTEHEDTINGFFLDMNSNVEIFAAKVKADPKLANGFNAIGISQGTNIIRGYIAKHNDPPVKRFISINGVNAGEGAVPYCIPKNRRASLSAASQNMCDLLMEQASRRAYSDFAQKHSFQANYWRDPRPVEKENYQQYAQLAEWNNEGKKVNETLKENWAKTDKFVWVMSEDDEMVWPKEGEHWGAPDPSDPFNKILPMKETEWYKKDLFGLRTADEEGKNAFESFPGGHCAFEMKDFDRWVNTYLKE